MKFKYKEFIIGIILGSLIFGSLSVLSDELLTATRNRFKVTVNGEEKPIEGYNINGSTYFKLRDIGKFVDFYVDFKEDTIMIQTEPEDTVNTDELSNESKGVGFHDVVNKELEKRGYIIEYEGNKYIEVQCLLAIGSLGSTIDISGYVNKYFDFVINDDRSINIYDREKQKLHDEKIQTYKILNNEYIIYSDYETIIKPFIDSILDKYGIPK